MRHLLIATTGVALLVVATTASASSADTSALTVPAAGPKSVSASWTGQVPVGLSTTFTDCNGNVATASHKIHVTVPRGAYNVVKAKLSFVVDSAPPLNGDLIELRDPSGATVGTDQQKSEMVVEVSNPVAGDYTALVCALLPDGPAHDYTASVTISTKCKAVSPCPSPKRKP